MLFPVLLGRQVEGGVTGTILPGRSDFGDKGEPGWQASKLAG